MAEEFAIASRVSVLGKEIEEKYLQRWQSVQITSYLVTWAGSLGYLDSLDSFSKLWSVYRTEYPKDKKKRT